MNLNKNDGFTLIELLVSTAIMAILSLLLLYIIKGSNTYYAHIKTNYEKQSEARIAMSYLTLKVRENDIENGVDIYNNKQGMKIRNSKGNVINIYFKENKLLELQDGKNESEAVEIAYIDSLEINVVQNEIFIKITYINDDNKVVILEENIATRCALK